jgi:hypothetical protein
MKRILLLLICTATLGLASCKKDTIIQETSNKTIIFDVNPSQWKLSNDGLSYDVSFNDIPELDDYSLKYEGTIVSVSFPNYTVYKPLPYVFDVNSYHYSVYQGGITISIESSDLQAPNPVKPTQPMKFKVVIVASNNVS